MDFSHLYPMAARHEKVYVPVAKLKQQRFNGATVYFHGLKPLDAEERVIAAAVREDEATQEAAQARATRVQRLQPWFDAVQKCRGKHWTFLWNERSDLTGV